MAATRQPVTRWTRSARVPAPGQGCPIPARRTSATPTSWWARSRSRREPDPKRAAPRGAALYLLLQLGRDDDPVDQLGAPDDPGLRRNANRPVGEKALEVIDPLDRMVGQ